jgi:radical SAM superfamily enzyme YgiQ (UPF0313 family)
MAAIILTTLNARYSHCSLGLRYLLANMGELGPETVLLEFIITQRPIDIVEKLLQHESRIIGFGVYIWNVEETTKVVALLKQVHPEVTIVLGGPEVSYEYEDQAIVQLADYLICGPGEISFAKLCRRLLSERRPAQKVISAERVALTQLSLPYRLYTEEDIIQRVIYVEASRGCPFKCEFCLSALDKTVYFFDLKRLLAELEILYERGVRQFRFVDRTFNLNVRFSLGILGFFLSHLDDGLFLHFELIPDHLPDQLKAAIKKFPKGSLQLEIGIQTFNPAVQALISRRQDNRVSEANLAWLRSATQAHLHADLIAGLPGEDLESFARGFNRLVALKPQEIQVGILKRLRGTAIARHNSSYGIRYNPNPPYNILCSELIDFATLQRLSRFARYWDMIANSGRFHRSLALLLGDQPFERFLRLSDWLYATTQQTHQIALDRLFDLIYRALTEALGIGEEQARQVLALDYRENGSRGRPSFLEQGSGLETEEYKARPAPGKLLRQRRHRSG